jgi:hypothetical protein
MDITSQNAAIKAALLKGEVITPIDALQRFNCFRLSARIYDLRNDYELPIEMVLSDGEKRFAKYFITPDNLAKLNAV